MSDRGIPTVAGEIFRSIRRAFGRFEEERHVDDGGKYTTNWGKLTFVVQEDELDGGWVAECVDLPGCFSQGETEDEALHNLSQAVIDVIGVKIEMSLESLNDRPAADERGTYSVAL